MTTHEIYMQNAIELALQAGQHGDVPVGAIIVRNGEIIARSYNMREQTHDPTAHAEMIALRDAAQVIGDWRFTDCTLYVTLEPCPMCAGALVNARMERIVFGAFDSQWGSCGTLYNLARDPRLPYCCIVRGGVLQEQCSTIIQQFFRTIR